MKRISFYVIFLCLHISIAFSNDNELIKKELQNKLDSIEVIIKNTPNLNPYQIELLRNSAFQNLSADSNFINIIETADIGKPDPQYDLLSRKQNIKVLIKISEKAQK